MIIFGLLILLILLGTIVGKLAKSGGRSFLLWFAYGALLFPVAIVHIKKARPLAKKCPACWELVRRSAIVCRHCDFQFVEQAA
jgi:hypothetical protein